MRYAGFLATVVAGVMMASVAAAQTARPGGPPQPAPPPGFEGSQYVDGRGCIYIRAGISGQINWVPRVGADREPICGEAPATVRPPVVAEAPAPAPAVVEPPPEPRQTAAAAPRVLNPVEETRPAIRQAPAATAIPPQRIIEIPRTPARTQPVALPSPVAETRSAEPVRRLTRSEVCAGRSGPLEGFVVASTGAPVNCGGSQRTASAPAPAPVRPAAVRVTRAEICTRMAETGERFLDQSTGEPVACPGTAPAVTTRARAPAPAPRTIAAPLSAVPVRSAASVPGVASCPGISPEAEAFLREIGAPLDCGPWSRSTARLDVPASNLQAPSVRGAPVSATVSGRTAVLVAPAPARVAAATPPAPLFRQPVPASNPTVLNPARSIASPPAGYRSVWDDGRVNPSRGLARPYF